MRTFLPILLVGLVALVAYSEGATYFVKAKMVPMPDKTLDFYCPITWQGVSRDVRGEGGNYPSGEGESQQCLSCGRCTSGGMNCVDTFGPCPTPEAEPEA